MTRARARSKNLEERKRGRKKERKWKVRQSGELGEAENWVKNASLRYRRVKIQRYKMIREEMRMPSREKWHGNCYLHLEYAAFSIERLCTSAIWHPPATPASPSTMHVAFPLAARFSINLGFWYYWEITKLGYICSRFSSLIHDW